LAVVVIGAAVLAAYHGTLRVPFVLDDIAAIPENPSIRALWPLTGSLSPPPAATTMGGRPIANLTMAVNYALSGTDPWSYHALNILIHILATLTLFGVVRRTLLLPILKDRFGRDSFPLALAVSLTWAMHPLQTESVTYVVQRVESLVGLLYLFCLYCFIRGAQSRRPLGWQVATVTACLAGMGTKEVMATAPVMLLLYDRTFLSGTFLDAWRRRRGLYLALSLTWVLLILLVAGIGWNRGGSAGFGSVSVWSYWATQFEALALYLKLSFWPHPLVFDYGTHLLPRFSDAVPYALVAIPVLAATLVALRFRPLLGFLGAWYFLILAPSSVVPVATQTIAEHRLYLPLAAVAAAFVVGAFALMGRRCWLPLSAVILGLGCLSSARNEVYSSPIDLWGDTAASRPGNTRAHNNLGRALFAVGRDEEAIAQYRISLGIEPADPGIHSNLGNALDRAGRTREAIEQYQAALGIQPDFAPAIFNLANALYREGRTAEAIAAYETVVKIQPDYADAYGRLGDALERAPGRGNEAIDRYRQALRLEPAVAQVHYSLAVALSKQGRSPEAISEYEEALRLQPDFAEASNDLGDILCSTGQVAAGIQRIEAALKIRPDDARAHFNLANALAQSGQIPESIGQYEEALRIQPELAEANSNLGMILCRSGRIPEGLAHIEAALRTRPDFAPAHFLRGLALLKIGRTEEAAGEFRRVLELRPNDPSALKMLDAIRNSR
jgi:tetratricopeptide (TPR) repeat protein